MDSRGQPAFVPSAGSRLAGTTAAPANATPAATRPRIRTSVLRASADEHAPEHAQVTRRGAMRLAAAAAASAAALAGTPPTHAVDFDTERYGDKEMKVSTINRTKQNVRNLLVASPRLTAAMIALPVLDALTYDPATNAGGLNASIFRELDESSPLREGLAGLLEIKQKTPDVSLADLLAFAGAVAVEVTSGPRIVVQLGREDAAKADLGAADLSFPMDTAQTIRAFERVGLPDPLKAAVLFRGAYGVLESIGNKRGAKKDEQDALEADLDDDVVTYGKVDKSRGRGAVLLDSRVSTLNLAGEKFGSDYLKGILELEKKDKGGLDADDAALLANEQSRALITKYASKSKLFANDFAEVYERLTLLGSRYESSKIRDE